MLARFWYYDSPSPSYGSTGIHSGGLREHGGGRGTDVVDAIETCVLHLDKRIGLAVGESPALAALRNALVSGEVGIGTY